MQPGPCVVQFAINFIANAMNVCPKYVLVDVFLPQLFHNLVQRLA
jgi:hypothetical protein